MAHKILNPPGWPAPRGYSNGVAATGETIFTGGMVGWDTEHRFAQGFVAQTRKCLENIVAVLAAGGAHPAHIVRMTWYVVDMDEYRSSLAELGKVYREVIGPNYPAMALVAVTALVERDARVEIEATAVIPR